MRGLFVQILCGTSLSKAKGVAKHAEDRNREKQEWKSFVDQRRLEPLVPFHHALHDVQGRATQTLGRGKMHASTNCDLRNPFGATNGIAQTDHFFERQ